jgi:hypothetical protein
VDHQHVFALVETVHGADFHAIHVFAFDAVLGDDIGHALMQSFLVGGFLARFPAMWNHTAGKNSRIDNMVKQILIAKTMRSWRNVL